MKLKGKKGTPPKPVKVVIFRENDDGDPDNLIFLCGAVLDLDKFEKVCPMPKPPLTTNLKLGTQVHDTNDPRYKKRIDLWHDQKVDYLVIRSLEATPGLEWEKVNIKKPDSWHGFRDELREFLTDQEMGRIIGGCFDANNPSENRRKEALDVFSRTPSPEAVVTTSPEDEAIALLSTEPVKDSASVPQA